MINRAGTSNSIPQSHRRLRDALLNWVLAQQTIDGICHWTLLDGIEFRWLCQPA
jgi:hypothetical protein